VEAGRFRGEDVFGEDGRYLGELRNNNRLITNLSKRSKRSNSFTPRKTTAHVKYVDYVGYVMYLGYEDFPDPSEFEKKISACPGKFKIRLLPIEML